MIGGLSSISFELRGPHFRKSTRQSYGGLVGFMQEGECIRFSIWTTHYHFTQLKKATISLWTDY